MPDSSSLPPTPVSWAYADAWAEEDPAIAAARRRSEGLGAPTIDRATGAALRVLTAALGASAVVEIGTGTGVSGAWIVGGLADHGSLTTVDSDPDLNAAARETFAQLGAAHTRVRAIAADPLDVLPRLADGAYDLMVIGPGVWVDADPTATQVAKRGGSADPTATQVAGTEDHELLAQALRLLRPGGALAICHALSEDGHRHDGHRDLSHHLRDDPRWIPALLTVGDGLLVAVRHPIGGETRVADPTASAEG